MPIEEASEFSRATRQIGQLRSRGRYGEAVPLAEQCLAYLQGRFGADHPSVARAHTTLGELHELAGDLDAAEASYRDAAGTWSSVQGEDPTYATSLLRLAALHGSRGQDAEAAALCEQAIEIFRRAGFSEHHPDFIEAEQGLSRYRARLEDEPEEGGSGSEVTDSVPAEDAASHGDSRPGGPGIAAGEPIRGAGEPVRGAGEPVRGAGEPVRGAGEPVPDAGESPAAPDVSVPFPDMLPTWKTVRVFLSSTFRDMHAERDHLVKVTFPRLRQWCAERRLHLVDIDLRWGVTREEAENGKAIEICLEEIDGSRPFFVCLLGERYGWVPEELPPEERFSFHGLQGETGCSITHLEILHAADSSLAADTERRRAPCRHAFFYLRRGDSLPEPASAALDEKAQRDYREAFFEGRPELVDRLRELKAWIRERFGPEDRVREYAPSWDPTAPNPEEPGLVGRLVELEPFGELVERDLRRAIGEQFPDHVAGEWRVDPLVEERGRHEAFLEARTRVHVRRAGLEEAITRYVEGREPRPLVVWGNPGSGKSAVLASWLRGRIDGSGRTDDELVLFRFVGASAASTNLPQLVAGLAAELIARFGLTEEVAGGDAEDPEIRPMEVPAGPDALREKWPRILEAAGRAGRVLLVLDGLDQLDRTGDPAHAHWLVREAPPGVRMVVSAAERAGGEGDESVAERAPHEGVGGAWLQALRRFGLPELPVPTLTDGECRRLIGELPSVFCKTLDDDQVVRILRNRATRNPLFLIVALEELRVFGSFERLEEAIDGLPQLDDPAYGGDVEGAIEALFGQILDRLDRETERQAPGLVPFLFSCLASAREGVSEPELEELSSSALSSLEEEARAGALQVVLRQLRPYLVRKATTGGAVVSFFHESFRRAVRSKYLARRDARQLFHRRLAGHFAARSSWIAVEGEDGAARRLPDERKAVELPWQLLQAAREADPDLDDGALEAEWAPLAEPLTDLDFVAAKCACDLGVELGGEYEAALEEWPGQTSFEPFGGPGSSTDSAAVLATMRRTEESAIGGAEVATSASGVAGEAAAARVGTSAGPGGSFPATAFERVQPFATFFAAHADVLTRFPEEAIPVARNHAAGGPVASQGERLAEAIARPWIARGPRPAPLPPRPAIVRTLDLGDGGELLSVTADGRTAVVSEPGGTIGCWELSTGERTRTLSGHAGAPLADLAVSADGATVVSASRPTDLLERLTALQQGGAAGGEGAPGVRVWDVATESCRREIPGRFFHVAVSGDGRVALLSGEAGGLEVWDLDAGVRRGILPAAPGGVRGLALTFDGRRAVVATADRTIEVWEVGAGRLSRTLEGHLEEIAALAVTADGRFAASGATSGWIGGKENALRVWDLETGDCIGSIEAHERAVNGVAVSRDGRIAVSVGRDAKLRVWDVAAGECVRDLRQPAESHALAVTASARTAITSDRDGRLRFWNLESGVPADELPRHDREDAGLRSAARSLGGFPGPLPDEVLEAGLAWVRTDAVSAVRVAGHGPMAVSAGEDSTLRIWDLDSGVCRHVLSGHVAPVNDVAITRDGIVVSAGGDNGLRAWTRDGEPLRTLEGHGGAVHGVDVAADGCTVVSGASGHGEVPYADHTVRVWDLPSGACLRILVGHGHWVMGVAVAPDGCAVASGSTDGTLRLWDVRRGEELHSILPEAGHVHRVAFSPDGRTVAAATGGGEALLFEAATGRRLGALEGHAGAVRDVAFDADGSTIVTGGNDGTVRAWDALELRCLAIYPAGSPVSSVSAVRLDARFACGCIDGGVHLLALRNRSALVPIVTAARRFRGAPPERHEGRSSLVSDREHLPGTDDESPSYDCPWCGATSVVPPGPLEAFDEWHARLPDHRPAYDLAHTPEAFADPRLAIECGGCGGRLRLNPFLCRRPRLEELDWRDDPALRGKFHADDPDDVQVLIHDGHPRVCGRTPELAWVRLHGKLRGAYVGTLLNAPFHLTSVGKGDDILLVARPGMDHPILVTEKYLEDRAHWDVVPCPRCGLAELLDAPSDVLEQTELPPGARRMLNRVEVPCALCEGSQLLVRKEVSREPPPSGLA